MPTIAILGTLDTKGEEHAFVAEEIRRRGHQVLVIDVGTVGKPGLPPDVTRDEIAAAAGADLDAVVKRRDRGEAIQMMSLGAPIVVSRLLRENKIDGIISLGGGGGTAIGTAAMRALPIGFPKVDGLHACQRQHGAIRGREGHCNVPQHCGCGRAQSHFTPDFDTCSRSHLRVRAESVSADSQHG